MIAGESELAKHTEFRSFATLNVACSSLSEAAIAIGSMEKHSMPLTGMDQPALASLPTMHIYTHTPMLALPVLQS